MITKPSKLKTEQGVDLAYFHRTCSRGDGFTVVFLGGFRSHMQGDKATAVDQWCAAEGIGCLRVDYRGHGASSGEFAEGCISDWIDDAVAVISTVTTGRLVLIGSSMGGWIMTHVALALRSRVVRLIGIAVAPDFTQRLIWPSLTASDRSCLRREGVIYVPSEYDDIPFPITRRLIDDGEQRGVLQSTIEIDCPVRLIHGQSDHDVPYTLSIEYARQLRSDDVELTLIKDGDHRLSSDRHLPRLMTFISDSINGAVNDSTHA